MSHYEWLTSHQQRMISQGAELAHCENVKSIHIPEANVHVRKMHVGEIIPHLKELYDRSTGDLAENECQEIHKLLSEFSDIFSTGPHDLGRTDIVQHHILEKRRQYGSSQGDCRCVRGRRQKGYQGNERVGCD